MQNKIPWLSDSDIKTKTDWYEYKTSACNSKIQHNGRHAILFFKYQTFLLLNICKEYLLQKHFFILAAGVNLFLYSKVRSHVRWQALINKIYFFLSEYPTFNLTDHCKTRNTAKKSQKKVYLGKVNMGERHRIPIWVFTASQLGNGLLISYILYFYHDIFFHYYIKIFSLFFGKEIKAI